MMRPPTRRATFIVRLWTDGDPLEDAAWRGTAEHIGCGPSCRFQTLAEFVEWLRRELAETGAQTEP